MKKVYIYLMKGIKFILALFAISLIIGCANDSSDDFLSPIPDVVNYTNHIKPIITSNCISCHNSNANPVGPFPLETYNEVRDKTENGNLLQRIQLPAGNPLIMPPTGKMSQTNIDIILKWKNQGYLEN